MMKQTFSSSARAALTNRDALVRALVLNHRSILGDKGLKLFARNVDKTTSVEGVLLEGVLRFFIQRMAIARVDLWNEEIRDIALNGVHSFIDAPFQDEYAPDEPVLRFVEPQTPREDVIYRTDYFTDHALKELFLPEGAAEVCQLVASLEDAERTTIVFSYIIVPGCFFPTFRFFSFKAGLRCGGVGATHAALTEFTKLPLAEVERLHINPKHAKRLARSGKAEAVPEIHRVLLRRSYQEAEPGVPTEDSAHGGYSCQWLVRGHWRNQYHPSTRERKPRFILPYVKGPEDKPLRVASATVREVRR